jgi:hypothetical protein
VRFTGQVRVPEVDHPGIPATIVVEDGLAEVLLDGESLGRWSLYDVHAARLVSSAFSISLDGEEITFIADEPVDFAYKGVEHMAGVWARYKAMTIPRRVVAVGRSRRGTTPSRIPELREAMLSNHRTAGPPSAQSALASPAPAAEADPSPWARRLDAYSSVPAPIDDADEPEEVGLEADEPAADLIEQISGTETPTPPEVAAPAEPETATPSDLEAAAQPARMRPGPGLIPRQVKRIAPVPSSLSDEPVDWDTAWEEPPIYEESYEELPSDADRVFLDELSEAQVVEQVDEIAVTREMSDDTAEVEEQIDEVEATGPLSEVTAEVEEQIDEVEATGEPSEEDSGGPVEVEPETEVSEQPALTTPRDEVVRPNEVVLDLGHLEADKRVTEPAAVAVADHSHHVDEILEPDLELLFAGAPGPEGERSGLLGAVRSAFARNRGGVHEHQFVEAPGGIGIVRQICAECGYISIGVSD